MSLGADGYRRLFPRLRSSPPTLFLLATSGDVSVPAPDQRSRCTRPDRRRRRDRAASEIVASAPTDFSAPSSVEAAVSAAPVQFASASRYRVYNREAERVLPVGLAPERGLQVKTILVARSISALFPEIQNIGGVRPDALRWHPDGLALDVMIPEPDLGRGHRARKPDRRVRTGERGPVRSAGLHLARHVLHAQRREGRRVRPLRPRPHHDARWRISHRRRGLHPLSLPRPRRDEFRHQHLGQQPDVSSPSPG